MNLTGIGEEKMNEDALLIKKQEGLKHQLREGQHELLIDIVF